VKIHLRTVTAALICLLIGITFGTALGCSTNSSSEDTNTSTGKTTQTVPTTSTTTSTSTPPLTLSPHDKELAKTARMQNALAIALAEEDVATDDPRMAVMFGLRARVQALSCRKALADGNLESARTAMTNIYATVNLGRNVAQNDVAKILTDAHGAIATLGDPSHDPKAAETVLGKFIDILAPLLDEAAKLTPTTSAT
jgi:hypothetical protein